MRRLSNINLRQKLLIAMAPLAIMVILAGVYQSLQNNSIDSSYRDLLVTDVEGLWSVTEARSHTNRFGMFLFELIAETEPAKRPAIAAQLDITHADFQSAIADALLKAPQRGDEIKSASVLFDRAIEDSRTVRAMAIEGQNQTALKIMHERVSQELTEA